MASSLKTSNIAHCRLSGGSYTPTRDSVIFITPPGDGTFPTYVPAGTEITCDIKPVFVDAPDAPPLPLVYCPGEKTPRKYQPVATENKSLADRTSFRVHYGRAETDDLVLPAGTLIQQTFEHCPSCLSSIAGAPRTSPSSSSQAGYDDEASDGLAAGTDSPQASHLPDSVEIDAEVFMFSRFKIGRGDHLLCPTTGGVSAFGVTNARGHFTIPSSDPSQVKAYNDWTSAEAEECDRGDMLPIPLAARSHYRLANVVGPRFLGCDDTFAYYEGDETPLSDPPIPTKFIKPLLDARTSNAESVREIAGTSQKP